MSYCILNPCVLLIILFKSQILRLKIFLILDWVYLSSKAFLSYSQSILNIGGIRSDRARFISPN